LFGDFAELGREFEQRLLRVDLRGLIRQSQALFGVLAAFFRRRHLGGPRVVQRRPRPYRSAVFAQREAYK
jgi:hypothetical protein